MKLAAIAVIALAGCFPKVVTHESMKSWREHGERVEGKPSRTELTITSTASQVIVSAVAARTCWEEYSVTETTRKKSTTVATGNSVGALIAAIPAVIYFWPAVVVGVGILAVSYGVSSIVTAVMDPQKSRNSRLLSELSTECPLVTPGLFVELTVASGTVLTARTDDAGIATFAMPDGEAEGKVVARAEDAKTGRGWFFRSRDACVAGRDAQLERPVTSEEQRARVLRRLPVCDAYDRDERAEEEAWVVMREAGIAAWEGDCRRALVHGAPLRTSAPPLYAKLLEEAAYQKCQGVQTSQLASR